MRCCRRRQSNLPAFLLVVFQEKQERSKRRLMEQSSRNNVMKPFLWILCAAATILGIGVPTVHADDSVELFSGHLEEQKESERKCRQHLWLLHGDHRPSESQGLYQEIEEFQSLVEESLGYREESIRVAERLKLQVRQRQPLSGADLDLLNSSMAAHLRLREKLYDVAEAHECWLPGAEGVYEKFSITPEGRYQAVMLSLAAALVLYDNYLLAVSIFAEDTKFRRFMNQSEPGYDIIPGQLSRMTTSYYSPYKRERARKAIAFYENHFDDNREHIESDVHLRYLNGLIQQSPSYSQVKRTSVIPDVIKGFKLFGVVTRDVVHYSRREGVGLFSRLFGNTAGLVETRKGKLYGREDVHDHLLGQLKAGDILLEKTPFRLTDILIPGYWGHVAIWIGTEQELVKLGIWDHPVVRNYHQQIRQGRHVVEALRPGVQLNSLQDFLNVDDLVVFRVQEDSDSRLADRLLLTFRQIGKPYDFNFDVETTNRIVCSELVYQTVTDITWPTKKSFGRRTISPDHVVRRLIDEKELSVVALYHHGVEIEEGRLDAVQKLLAARRVTDTSFSDAISNDHLGR